MDGIAIKSIKDLVSEKDFFKNEHIMPESMPKLSSFSKMHMKLQKTRVKRLK